MKRYRVEVSDAAQEDMELLHDFLSDIDMRLADKAIGEIHKGYDFLKIFPQSCRLASFNEPGSVYRELIVNFGKYGYLVLFEINDEETLTIVAVRHQRESSYH
jgi:plasmid stabilization system protein ParE